MTLLSLENCSKSFLLHILGDKLIHGFSNVSFTLSQGKSLGLSGPSGVGKSSVLKCIFGTYITTNGAIWYESSHFGRINLARTDVTTISRIRQQELGYITQFLKVLPRVSAVDIVAGPLLFDGVNPKEARMRARALLSRLGIGEHLFDAFPTTFSGGEQQRVNIARAVIKAPRLLMLDEPTASLDAAATAIVLEVLKELRRAGTTMVGVFHQREILEAFSDEIHAITAPTGGFN